MAESGALEPAPAAVTKVVSPDTIPVPVIPFAQPAPAEAPMAQANAKDDDEDDNERPNEVRALALPAELSDLVGMLKKIGGVSALKEMIGQFKASADEEITALESLITANSDFTKDELSGLPASHLRKLANNTVQVEPDYTGRGGGIQAQTPDDGWAYGWTHRNKEAQ